MSGLSKIVRLPVGIMDNAVDNTPSAVALEEELRERNRELASLNDLAVAVASSLELDETLRVALTRIFDLVNVSRGGIALIDRDSAGLVTGIASGVSEEALNGGLATLCATRGTPLLLSDTTGREDVPPGYEDAGSVTVVPLKSGGRVVGVLTVLGDEAKRFSQHDVSILTAVASLVGPAVENAGLFAQISQKVVEVTALNAMAHSISRRLDLHAILDSCLTEISTLVPFERASIVLVSEVEPEQGIVEAVSGTVAEPAVGSVFRMEETMPAETVNAGKLCVVDDIGNRMDWVAAKLFEQGIRSWVIVPLLSNDGLIGTLNVASASCDAYNARQVSILEGVAGHLSVAVANARLYESLRSRTLQLEALARETQHRVQNNLQMIAGLVSMIGSDGNVQPKSVSRCLSQIQAISVIHEMLSCEHDIGEVNLKDSVDRIARMAAVAACGEKTVSIKVDGNDICLPSKYASAVGIAINELVANAIEHGFEGRDSGRIDISIKPSNGRTEILVHDDGVGLPEGFSLGNSQGSGLNVLSMLLGQGLGGALELENKEGTLARILIKC